MNGEGPALTSSEGRAQLKAVYRNGLLDDTLGFWFPRCLDTTHGGYYSAFDREGTLVDSDKSVWAQGRIAWMLLAMYNGHQRRPEWLEWARHGLEFLERCCFDTDGRMFFQVAADGRPVRKRRYAYSESFAAIAHAAYARATGDARSARRARDLFELYMRWNFTPGLMPAKFSAARPTLGLGPRMIAIVTAQELRANLNDPGYNAIIDRMIEEIRRWFVKPERQVVMETVGAEGEVLDHFDGRTLNPGHAIEGAWFMLREAHERQNTELLNLGCQMLDWMWARGWDREYGGIYYFRDLDDKPVQEYWHDMKFWWPHNETIIATLLAWTLTGAARYAQWHQAVHAWAHRHFADPEHGEWYGYLHRDGRISNTLKGSLWKSFFHLPRMQWVCWQTLEAFDRKSTG